MLRMQRCVPEIFNPSKLQKFGLIYQQVNRKRKFKPGNKKTCGIQN